MSRYPESEYNSTHKVSTAAELIRAQGEQIRRMTVDEYIREKTGGGADERLLHGWLSEIGCRRC